MHALQVLELPAGTRIRVAVLGDIHGNWVALQEVARDLAARQADVVIGLGDYLNTSRGAAPVVKWMREQPDAYFVRGDNDRWESYERFRSLEREDSYDLYRYVTGLPEELRIRVGPLHLLARHGYPWPPGEGVNPNRVRRWLDRGYIESQVELEGIHVACFGDLHQWSLRLDDDRLLLHPGSVGAPADPGPCAAKYLLLEIEEEAVTVELRAAPFSVEAAIQEAREGYRTDPGPNVWLARWLRAPGAEPAAPGPAGVVRKEKWMRRGPG